MKFRRGIAKLLVAVTIVELVLSSINRSEYVVLAATDETTQSELVAETESQDEAERTLADTMGVIAENIDEEDVQSLSEATTEAGVLEETESDEEGTESSESDTTSDEGETENGEAGTEKDVTEETTENTEEGTTEESNENTESSVGDTTESSKGDATENTESTITEETTTEGNSEKSTEDTTEDRSSETSGATKEETGTSSEDTTETKDSSGKVSEKDTQNSIMDTVREAIEEMDNAEPQAVGEIDLGNPTVPATKAELDEQDKNSYYIMCYQDWLNLQLLSQETDLSGYTFAIGLRNGDPCYDFEELRASGYTAFDGIGSKDYPFRGTIYADYLTGITLKTDHALFQYLSTEASVYDITIEPHEACAGLAEYLQVDSEEFKKLNNVLITNGGTGIVGDAGETAGGLFANVVNDKDYAFVLQGTEVKVNPTVTGDIAGGIIGSMTGSVTMVMDGGIQWAPSVETLTYGTSITGGWIGSIDANNGTITIQSDGEADIAYDFQGVRSSSKKGEVTGGLFGEVFNATISVENKLTIKKSTASGGYDLTGLIAGSFAGKVENCIINLQAEVNVDQIRIKPISSSSVTEKGIGGFIGVIKESTIDCLTGGKTLKISGVYVNYGGDKSARLNIGGLAGYAYNSKFLFSQSECIVNNFSSKVSYGNVAGAIGLFKADQDMEGTDNAVIQRISVTGTTTAHAVSGNAAGLIGKMDLADCHVKMEKCYAENIRYAANCVSLGIGQVYGNGTENAKLTISQVVVNGTLVREDGGSSNPTVGGMIATADVDLEIKGTVDADGKFDTACQYFLGEVGQWCANIGGLIGIMEQSGDYLREVDISNVLVGCKGYDWYGQCSVYGGLIAKTQDKTSICLDEKIHMDGGTASNWKGTDVSVGSLRHYPSALTYFGSVVGSQNYTLIYLQPTAKLVTSSYFATDEVGNYGGIFRNGNWDTGDTAEDGSFTPEDGMNPDTWLIQDHAVTGEWKYYKEDNGLPCFKIETIGDFMRLAIYGNTYNATTKEAAANGAYDQGEGYFPCSMVVDGVSQELSNVEMGWAVMFADFYLEPGIYDLTGTGIDSLYRNDGIGYVGGYDNEGAVRWATGRSKNSLICEDGEATIKYAVDVYGHIYTGLFPSVDGADTKTVKFENLNLDYTIQLKKPLENTTEISYSSDYFVGGLVGRGVGNISITNVNYTGTIDELTSKANAKKYMGGLFGGYSGENNKTLDIVDVEAEFNCNFLNIYSRAAGIISILSCPTNSGEKGIVNMDNIQLTGSIVATHKSGAVALEMGGLIAHVYRYVQDAIYMDINISDVSIDDFVMGSSSQSSFAGTGGFFGYSWKCCDVSVDNVSIGTQDTAKLKVWATQNGGMGGLLHDIRGRMYINDFTYGKNTVFDNWSGSANVGLLVYNGQYLYLDVTNYTIEDGVTLINNNGTYFDELVSISKGGASTERGGIVSISTSDETPDDTTDDTYYLGRNGEAYSSYAYGTHVKDETGNYIQKENPNTRYYYDLRKLDFSVDYKTISSADVLMVWHIMHYANDYLINSCFVDEDGNKPKYYATYVPTSYTITGDIDMTGYSIYPTTLTKHETYNATGAKIKLNAQAIYAGENDSNAADSRFIVKYPNDSMRQHYQMHAGLFYNVYSGVDVDGLTLAGSYSISDTNTAGALVCGTIYGVEDGTDSQGETLYKEDVESNFNNITLSDLWCVASESKLAEDDEVLSNPIGLMISNIAAGAKVNMDGIYMQDYKDDEVSGYKAASALIGNVGDEDATYISLTFKNMDIMDAAANASGSSLNSSKCEEALARASFIYSYNYRQNCSAIYTFTSKDYLVGKLGVNASSYDNYEDDGVVTLGQELGNQDYDGTNYAEILYYDNEDPVGMASLWVNEDKSEVDTGAVEIKFNCNNYLPYVFTIEQDILVNPKIADIEQGCGTYEDPYIISSATQLITIYRYLYEEELYKEVLGLSGNEWEMHATGDDTSICNGTEESDMDTTGHGPLIPYEKERSEGSLFPTKAELSQAYYMITDDIDLSKYTEFAGFGREDMPFIGVFVGNAGDNSSGNPTITMLEQSTGSLSQYAFIQVAKGVVVKDLTISFPSTISINSESGGIGAGVIATVAGGDNIIDNVTVTSTGDDLNFVPCFSVENQAAIIGGYVGVVDLGGVILRNMNFGSLSGFSVSVTGEIEDYPYVGSVIGRVLDGYVVYDDGQSQSDVPLFDNMEIAETLLEKEMPLCSTYNILNGAYLKTTSSKIEWTGSGFKIADNKQLQIMSMALNSGMLNYGAIDTDNNSYGYASDSRQRNGDYSCVGNRSAGQFSTVYNDVISGDNKDTFADSYLWQFFTDGSDSQNMVTAANSDGLNPIYVQPSTILTYTLTGEEYEMSVFEMGFRGLGARYHCTEYTSPNGSNTQLVDTTLLFKSHFIGSDSDNPAHINLDMEVTYDMDSRRAGLLNEVPSTGQFSNSEILIQNITLSGKVENRGWDATLNSSKTYYVPNVHYNAGGFMSDAVNKLTFTNVTLEGLTVDATGYAGGLVGHVKEYVSSEFKAQDITLGGSTSEQELTVIGGCTYGSYGVTEGHAGGLVGKFQCGEGSGSNIYIGTDADFNTLAGITGNHVTVYTRGRNSSVGGVIGDIEDSTRKNYSYINNTVMTNLTVYTENAYKGDAYQTLRAGGIIGYAQQARIHLYDVTVGSTDSDDSVLIALKSTNIDGENYVAINSENSGAGGLIGQSYANGTPYIEVENCQVLGVIDSLGNATTQIQGFNNTGGMVGRVDKGTVADSTVEGASIQGICNTGGCAGMIKGYVIFSITDTTVTGCEFSVTAPYTQNGDSMQSISGYTGGLVGTAAAKISIIACSVSDNIISSKNSRVAGGFVGQATNVCTMGEDESVSGENVITGNVICGDVAGGVFGTYYATDANEGTSDIIVSNNRIVSMMHSTVMDDNSGERQRLAGGFAGKLNSDSNFGAIEEIRIEDNLITGLNSKTHFALGGVIAESEANAYFYDVKLSNNYIGVLKYTELITLASNLWEIVHPTDLTAEDAVKLVYYLEKTDMDTLTSKLYWRTNPSDATEGTLCSITDAAAYSEEDSYQCSYAIGAVAGRKSKCTNKCTSFVNINVWYDDNTYRPIFDVGMRGVVTDTESVYTTYRSEYNIVYDSMDTEDPVSEDEYAGFSNLELIFNKYKNATDLETRYAYRLDDNYLAGAFSEDIDLTTIYEETYKKGENYISDFVDRSGDTVPLVVFRTTDYGSLDDVIQTYVNMLTNNSGALNTYSSQQVEVTTTQMELESGKIYEGDGLASVQVIKSEDNKFEFVNEITNEDGTVERLYDQMTDENNVTFSLVRITYQYNQYNAEDKTYELKDKWVLEIPVYVEQELEFDSHMRFVNGIEYNVNEVKSKGTYFSEGLSATGLDRGDSYTLYLEYVYGEARVRYENAVIPKKLSMVAVGDRQVSFFKGTQFTLIDLKNGGKPYYYVSDGTEGITIDFTDFSDSEGSAYKNRNINDCTEYVDSAFVDVCGETKENVAVENYLLLVDTSQVDKDEKDNRTNVLYDIYTDISELENLDPRLYSRIEYTEHCYVRVNEYIGVSCEFTEEPVLDGAITEGGSVEFTMEYNVEISPAWQNANRDIPTYLDIAISLQKKVDNITQKVALPAGTQVYFEILNDDSTSTRLDTVYVIQGNGISDVYYYANSNEPLDITTLATDTTYTNKVRVILDFSMADMSAFENVGNDAEYGIAADLLISTDQENPGNGEVRDSVYRTVKVDVSSELGFALQPNELIRLGINRYQPSDTDTGIMPFAAKIAFPEDDTQEDVKGKYYSIVYQIEEKTTRQEDISAPIYQLYTGNDAKLYLGTEADASKELEFKRNDSVKYYYSSLTDTDLAISDNIAEVDFVLEAGENMDFTNYRITGYLIISDSELSNPVSEIQDNSDLNSDFFVYTIANIKTDLN